MQLFIFNVRFSRCCFRELNCSTSPSAWVIFWGELCLLLHIFSVGLFVGNADSSCMIQGDRLAYLFIKSGSRSWAMDYWAIRSSSCVILALLGLPISLHSYASTKKISIKTEYLIFQFILEKPIRGLLALDLLFYSTIRP